MVRDITSIKYCEVYDMKYVQIYPMNAHLYIEFEYGPQKFWSQIHNVIFCVLSIPIYIQMKHKPLFMSKEREEKNETTCILFLVK